MSVLFLSSANEINKQEKLLMRSLSKSSHSLLLTCPENSPLTRMANSHGIPFLEFSKSLWTKFFTLRSFLKKNPSTIVHALDSRAFRFAQFLRMSIGKSLRVVISHHDPIGFEAPKPFITPDTYAIQKFLTKKDQVLLVSSLGIFNALQKQNVKGNALGLLPYSVDLEEAFPEEVAGQYLVKPDINKRFIFLIDTPLEKDSGIDVLLKALVYLKKQLGTSALQVEIHICGSGSLFDELLEEAQTLGVDSMIAFLEKQNIQLFYKNSHAVICPAISGEGNYRSILMAWRASLPVVSSDFFVHTKVLLSGKSAQPALIFPKDNANALAKCMLQVINKKATRNNLTLAGKDMLQLSRYEDLETKYLYLVRNL